MESSQPLSSQPHHQMLFKYDWKWPNTLSKYLLLTQQIVPTMCQVAVSQVKGSHPRISQEKAEGTRWALQSVPRWACPRNAWGGLLKQKPSQRVNKDLPQWHDVKHSWDLEVFLQDSCWVALHASRSDWAETLLEVAHAPVAGVSPVWPIRHSFNQALRFYVFVIRLWGQWKRTMGWSKEK